MKIRKIEAWTWTVSAMVFSILFTGEKLTNLLLLIIIFVLTDILMKGEG